MWRWGVPWLFWLLPLVAAGESGGPARRGRSEPSIWLVGSTPEELLDNPPVNHQSNFIPDYDPTVEASTTAGAAAVLTFLAKS